MKLVFRRRLYIGFALAIVLSAASGLTSYIIFQKQISQREWVKRARGITDSARNIQNLLINMETGRRGFRVTNQKQFLAPYTVALSQMEPGIAGLKKLLTNQPEQEEKALVLEQHIHDLVKFWNTNGDD